MQQFLTTRNRWLLALLLLSSLSAGVVYGQADSYTLVSWSIDSGVAQMSAGGYTVNAVIGQPDVGQVSSGDFTINVGIMSEAIPTAPMTPAYLYLPIARR